MVALINCMMVYGISDLIYVLIIPCGIYVVNVKEISGVNRMTGATLQYTERRSWFSETLTATTSVTADTEITEITTLINNADVSLISIDAVFSAAGKLYYVDENGNENYLTPSSVDYGAKDTILATFFLKKGLTVSLRYSASCTMHHLYVCHTSGVF
jgi:hypothetical protein